MISFQNVHKSFGSKAVLKGISFAVREGQILFVLGTSGTGKSVVLKNLVGLMKPDSGKIFVNDTEITELSELDLHSHRRNCGMVFQQPALFDSMTVFENVAFGLRKHQPDMTLEQLQTRVRECLSLVHLTNVESKMPQEISYGMQKRVSLARTLAVNPRILLFDEPTTGLDPVTTNAVNQLILELSKKLKTTSVVVSHDMQCALEIADYILVLDDGKVVANGTPTELKQSSHALVQDFLKEVLDVEDHLKHP